MPVTREDLMQSSRLDPSDKFWFRINETAFGGEHATSQHLCINELELVLTDFNVM